MIWFLLTGAAIAGASYVLGFRDGHKRGFFSGWGAKRSQMVDGFDALLKAQDLVVYMRKNMSSLDHGDQLADLCETKPHESAWGPN